MPLNKLQGAKIRLKRTKSTLRLYKDRLENPPSEGTFWKSKEFPIYYKRCIIEMEKKIKSIENEITQLTLSGKKLMR